MNYLPNLLIATLLGTLIGLEREWARKEPGIRTFSFIALGAASFIISSELIMQQNVINSTFDATRILGQIILGIGFLGAGVIVFKPKEDRVGGLTTAAMVWVTAAIGSLAGLGFYKLALIITSIVLLMNLILIPIENKLDDIFKKMKIKTGLGGEKEDEE